MEYSFKDFVAGKIGVKASKTDWPKFADALIAAGHPKWGTGTDIKTRTDNADAPFGVIMLDGKPWGGYAKCDTVATVNYSDLAPVWTSADFFSGRVACKCDTREEYDRLMRECEKAGKEWPDDAKPTASDRFGIGYTYTLGDPYNKGNLKRCTETNRPSGCTGCRSGDCGHKINVPFSDLFPSDPWADFMAGKCYLRVTKDEWPEFAKRCEAAGVYYRMHARNLADYPSDYEVKGAVYAAYNIEVCPDLGLSKAGESNRHHLPCLDFSSIRKPAPVAPVPHPVKVGDRIRILMDCACSADVKKGDVFKVKTVRDTVGGIYVDHNPDWGFSAEHYEIVAEPDPVKFKVGDIVRGIDPNKYTITNTSMTRGEVKQVSGDIIRVKVLERKCGPTGAEFDVDPKYFALVETPAPRAVKIGDTVRFVKKSRIESQTTTAEIGKTYKVEGFSERGNIRLNVASCPYVNPEDVELVDVKPETPSPEKPFRSKGYKVGDLFIIGDDKGCTFQSGDVVRVDKIDGNNIPYCVRLSDGKRDCVADRRFLPYVKPAPAAPQYKVGDRFKVKSKSGAVRFHYDVGDVIRMTRPDLDADRANFVRDTDGLHQIVLFANLEPVPSPSFPRIEITTDGRVTIATLYEDGKPVKTGKATCSPEDRFDFMAGAALAMIRLRYGAHAQSFTNLQARDWAQELTALSAKIKGAIGE